MIAMMPPTLSKVRMFCVFPLSRTPMQLTVVKVTMISTVSERLISGVKLVYLEMKCPALSTASDVVTAVALAA